MKLYHITFNLKEPDEKEFVPRIPKWILERQEDDIFEDVMHPRICFSDNIDGALQAVGSYNRTIKKGALFKVYSFEADPDDPFLIHPEELFKKEYVFDALENREYWYTKKINLKGETYKIKSFYPEHDYAWTILTIPKLKDIIKRIFERNQIKDPPLLSVLNEEFHDSKELYYKIQNLVNDGILDELDSCIEVTPWVQILRLKTCVEKI